jgi:predicted Ser/Thr protein kinase
MQCAQCATPVPDDAKFCHNCGSQVSDAEGQAAATASMDASAFRQLESSLREETRGEFEVVRMLGRGGMAVVYLATDIHLGRKIAIKVLPPDLTFGHGVERFKREAKTAAALDHPNIIPIYRVATGGKLFWYAMKYLEGQSLEDLLKQKRLLPPADTVEILAQVAAALDYAHSRRVVHRDVKPANIMLDAGRRVMVTDFGIAKALSDGTLTASGAIMGTALYMSPEQGAGKPVGGRSDQYSVAVMAYRMLTGQVPFDGDSVVDILLKHQQMPPPPMDLLRPGLPEHQYLAVHKGLEKDPERRFSTVSQLVEALRRPTDELKTYARGSVATVVIAPSAAAAAAPATAGRSPPAGLRTSGRTEVMESAARQKRRRWLLTGGAAALVTVAAAIGLTVLPDRNAMESAADSAAMSALRRGTVVATPPRGGAGDTASRAAEPPPLVSAPSTGRITVTNLPAGGTITALGERRAASFELPPGEHLVELRATGYQAQRTPVTVRAGAEITLPFVASRIQAATREPSEAGRQADPPPNRATEPARQPADTNPAVTAPAPATRAMATFLIAVRPAAQVFIDGQPFGERTRFQHEAQAGVPHLLRFARDGYVTLDTTVTLGPGARQVVNIALRPVP